MVDAAAVERLLERVTAWAASREDVRAAALVGSWAGGAPSAGSDVDVVLLSSRPSLYVDDDAWLADLGGGRIVNTRAWGVLAERRALLDEGGIELDLGVATPDWAATDPLDPGTRRVASDGLRPLHDPDGLLRELARALQPRGVTE